MESGSGRHEYQCHQVCGRVQLDRAYPLLVKRDLFGESLLGEVTHSVVVSICQEMRQLVLALGILLQHTPGLKQARVVCTRAGSFTAVQCPLSQLFQVLL